MVTLLRHDPDAEGGIGGCVMYGTMAVSGAMGGAAICLLAGLVGTRAVLAAAVNNAQRHILRVALKWGAVYAACVMAIILLAAFGVLPNWAFALAALLWFGPLLPALGWAHRRLDAAAGRAEYGASPSAA